MGRKSPPPQMTLEKMTIAQVSDVFFRLAEKDGEAWDADHLMGIAASYAVPVLDDWKDGEITNSVNSPERVALALNIFTWLKYLRAEMEKGNVERVAALALRIGMSAESLRSVEATEVTWIRQVEAAEILGRSRGRVAHLVAEGKLESNGLRGQRSRVTRESVYALKAQRDRRK